METSSSSKVTVEYHDPAGVFSLIANDLTSRLPLRNLNWQSHARPLRQIKHLHVDFVPSPETQSILRLPAKNDSRPADSIDILRSGFDLPKPTAKERRHQIPGFKTTPFVKLYILRCDDKDWYKQEERKKLKDWIQIVKSEDSHSGHHDASEWLIVHVVIPDTVAASEPRWRESTRDPDELKERSKGKKTVLDRLRADFSDGKGSDHIAQIRLSKSQIAVDLLPVPALAKTIEESADEREKSWSDLMGKIRSSILASFDARVRRYEEDIAEQEARRSLPGWNFCTFFVHKEGLARALESVGLVEDALALYDELSLDLETVLTDIASGEAARTATSFSTTGADIVARIKGGQSKANGVLPAHRLFAKDYREEIVTSTISIFDFFCYLFDRQISLILRLAGRTSGSVAASGIREGGDDLVMLAEICWRGLSFLHNGARSLKQDLISQMPLLQAQILVSSWTYAAATYILSESQSVHLDLSDHGLKTPGKLTNGHAKSGRIDFGFSMGADAYPQRNSSLTTRKFAPAIAELKSVSSTASAGRNSEDGLFSPPSSSGTDGMRPAEVPGLAELAAYRAELVTQQRKTVDFLAEHKGWHSGWNSLAVRPTLTDDAAPRDISQWLCEELTDDLSDSTRYEALYEALTETATRHYLLSTHIKSAEMLMGDIAILKYSQGDYESAAKYFEHALPMFKHDGWQSIEMEAHAMYISSLRKQNRTKEALAQAFELRAVMLQHDREGLSIDAGHRPFSKLVLWETDLARLLGDATGLSEPMTLQFIKYFSALELDHCIKHNERQDGFTLGLRFEHLMRDVDIDEITLHLTNIEHPGIEVALCTAQPLQVSRGPVEAILKSNATTFGMFHVDTLLVRAGNILFRHEFQPRPNTTGLISAEKTEHTEPDEKRQCLALFPAQNAFSAHIQLSPTTIVNKARYCTLRLSAGWNDVKFLLIHIKPATAGLRIFPDSVTTEDIQHDSTHTNAISLGPLVRETSATVHVKYTLEHPTTTISMRVEVNYTTPQGVFDFVEVASLATELPLDVEVKDTFHFESLFSTFTIRTTSQEAVFLQSARLHESEAFAVRDTDVAMTPTIVLSKQPVELVYRMTRKHGTVQLNKEQAALNLQVECIPYRDLIAAAINASLSTALLASPFAALQGLIMPVMTLRWHATYTHEDIDIAALMGETKVPSFADIGWFDIIDALPGAMQRQLSDWLMKWHIQNQRLELDPYELESTMLKRITMAVDVPNLDYAFTASLKIQTSDHVLIAGEPVQARLHVKSTGLWSTHAGLTKSSKEPSFEYEIHADPETWLISGRRRSLLAMSEHGLMVDTEVLLVPLKPGTWSLPAVTIRPGVNNSQDTVISFETCCTSAGEVAHVISDDSTARTIALESNEDTDHI